MSEIFFKSKADQVADHLRSEIENGILQGKMHGVRKLSRELGVNHKTLGAAFTTLEKEGLLLSGGARRGRGIVPENERTFATGLKISLLTIWKAGQASDYFIGLRHLLEKAGHRVSFAVKTLSELDKNVDLLAECVAEADSDAWIVSSGPREFLEWFPRNSLPVFSLFGQHEDLQIAGGGPMKTRALEEATQKLMKLGHTRISLIVRDDLRKANPMIQAYLEALKAGGVLPGAFHLPEWGGSADGFQEVLESLFSLTPPTTLILDEIHTFLTAYQFLARKGLRVPEDVSIMCTDYDEAFAWCRPSITHIRWDYRPVIQSVVRWAGNVRRNKDDFSQTWSKARFVQGKSIGRIGKKS